MRRKEKEITDPVLLQSVIDEAIVCRLALCDGATPYIVPMNFGYKDGRLYFHCAREGRKLDILRKNPQVCFEMDVHTDIMKAEEACNWSIGFKSIIGYGDAVLVEDFRTKKEALDIIMEKYSGAKGFEYPDKAVYNVGIIQVDIKSMTGKISD